MLKACRGGNRVSNNAKTLEVLETPDTLKVICEYVCVYTCVHALYYVISVF